MKQGRARIASARNVRTLRRRTGGMIQQAMRAAVIVLTAAGATGASAQTAFEWAGKQGDWDVFHTGEGSSRVCWTVSKPQRQEARRGSQRVSVNRGDTYLMVAVRPAQGVRNEVSTVIGYTFRENSTVRVAIGSSTFSLFTAGDKAWPENAAADDQLVAAMKRGANAALTGESSRGTTTVDTYSLSGFTAAIEQAQSLCR
jgi:invasion protein IalB